METFCSRVVVEWPPMKSFDALKFSFDTQPTRLSEMSAINDATSTFLTSFTHRGGKIIFIQGLSDPVFSANDLQRYYQQLIQNTGGDFSRLFLVPGMTHCGGGPALDNFDPLTLLEQWLRQGKAPDSMLATGRSFPHKSQPLCAWPKVTMYRGGCQRHDL